MDWANSEMVAKEMEKCIVGNPLRRWLATPRIGHGYRLGMPRQFGGVRARIVAKNCRNFVCRGKKKLVNVAGDIDARLGLLSH